MRSGAARATESSKKRDAEIGRRVIGGRGDGGEGVILG